MRPRDFGPAGCRDFGAHRVREAVQVLARCSSPDGASLCILTPPADLAGLLAAPHGNMGGSSHPQLPTWATAVQGGVATPAAFVGPSASAAASARRRHAALKELLHDDLGLAAISPFGWGSLAPSAKDARLGMRFWAQRQEAPGSFLSVRVSHSLNTHMLIATIALACCWLLEVVRPFCACAY
jgi:hypothetical protein